MKHNPWSKKVGSCPHQFVVMFPLIALFLFSVNVFATTITEVHRAIIAGNFAEVKRLVNEVPDRARWRDENCTSVLHYAAKYGRMKTAKFLLEKGADINEISCQEMTPLKTALVNGHKELAEYLRQCGGKQEWIARDIFHAVENKDLETVTRLLDAKPELINELGVTNETLLGVAISRGSEGMIKMLLTKGAVASADALYAAITHGDEDMVEMLLKKRAPVNANDSEAYYNACWRLLNARKRAFPVTSREPSEPPEPGFIAEINRFQRIIILLIEYGAKPSKNEEWRALEEAASGAQK